MIETIGVKQGYKKNDAIRERYRSSGGGRELAVIMLEMLERRSGRTTFELCEALTDYADVPITRERLSSITDMARKLTRRHENADIRAIRDEFDGRKFYYFLVYSPDDLIRKCLDQVQRALSIINSGHETMRTISAYTLTADQSEIMAYLRTLLDGIKNGIGLTLDQVQKSGALPGAVEEAANNAKPPSYEERGMPARGARARLTPGTLWQVASSATGEAPERVESTTKKTGSDS